MHKCRVLISYKVFIRKPETCYSYLKDPFNNNSFIQDSDALSTVQDRKRRMGRWLQLKGWLWYEWKRWQTDLMYNLSICLEWRRKTMKMSQNGCSSADIWTQNLSQSRNATHCNVETSTLCWCFHPGDRYNVMCAGNSGTTVRTNQLHLYDIRLLQRMWKVMQQSLPQRWENLPEQTASLGLYKKYVSKIYLF